MSVIWMPMNKSINIDEYIASFPLSTQEILEQIRVTIRNVAPEAVEVISYGMPAFKLNGILVWFAAYSKHIGFYPKASVIEVFKKDISSYKSAKGSIQFPLNKPMPLELISEIVKYRVMENMQKTELKKK
jgi:uncharacterized protein YdhG (YjbR/CyaY superfamily)